MALALTPVLLTPVLTLTLVLAPFLIMLPHDRVMRLVTIFLLLKLTLPLHMLGIAIP